MTIRLCQRTASASARESVRLLPHPGLLPPEGRAFSCNKVQTRSTSSGVTPPRFITKNARFYITVRAVNRSFRFVPKKAVCKAIRYSLGVVLEKYRNSKKLVLHEFEFMSNHYHLLGTDLDACLPDFVRELNSLLSRELNALRGIRGKNIEPGYGLVQVVGDERIVEHAVYTLANPVAAFLVSKSRHWPGISSLRMKYGKPVEVSKPKLGLWSGKNAHANRSSSKRSGRAGYAGRSKLPETVHLVIDRPDIMPNLSDDELRSRVLEELDKREKELAAERRRRNIEVAGRRAVESRHFLEIPGPEEMFSKVPHVSGSTREERETQLRIREAFLEAYYAARDAFRGGNREAVFPYGTWMMRRIWNARCEPAPS